MYEPPPSMSASQPSPPRAVSTTPTKVIASPVADRARATITPGTEPQSAAQHRASCPLPLPAVSIARRKPSREVRQDKSCSPACPARRSSVRSPILPSRPPRATRRRAPRRSGMARLRATKRFREWAPGLPGIGSSAAASVAVTTRRRLSRPTRMSGVSGGGAASPTINLNLSVPRVGRKTGMTLVIARLQFEIRALARRAADELDEPPRTPHPRQGQRRRGQGGDPPPRRGCRLSEIRRLSPATPTTQRNAEISRAFGGELERPPRCGHRKARDLRYDRAPTRNDADLPQSNRGPSSRRRL